MRKLPLIAALAAIASIPTNATQSITDTSSRIGKTPTFYDNPPLKPSKVGRKVSSRPLIGWRDVQRKAKYKKLSQRILRNKRGAL